MTRCHATIRSIYLGLLLSVLLVSCAAQRESSVLLLPESQDEYDELMRAGTREFQDLAGLSIVQPRNSSTAYYVIDRRSAARRQTIANLGMMSPRGYISIVQDQGLLSGIVHLELDDSNSMVVRDLVFEDKLLGQVYTEISKPFNSEGVKSFEYTEYRYPGIECDGLADSILLIESALQDAISSVGGKRPFGPGEVQEVIADGIGYSLQVRMQELVGKFYVGENSGLLFDAVRSVLIDVQNCRDDHPGVVREFQFYG